MADPRGGPGTLGRPGRRDRADRGDSRTPGRVVRHGGDAGGVAALSDTGAQADNDSAHGEASAVELGGDPPSEQFGGEANAEQRGEQDEASGALMDTGESEDGRIRAAAWEAEASSSDEERYARGEAWLAHVNLGGEDGVNVEAVHSRSEARHLGQSSNSNAETEALDVRLGGDALHIEVLHAESSSEGSGTAYLVAINDNQIGSAEQFDQQCNIEIPGLLQLICVAAEGGEGSAISKVAEAVLGPDADFTALLFGTGSVGAAEVARAADDFTQPEVLPAAAEPEAGPPEQARAADTLPVTGGSLQWALLGLVLASLGAAGRWALPRLATARAEA